MSLVSADTMRFLLMSCPELNSTYCRCDVETILCADGKGNKARFVVPGGFNNPKNCTAAEGTIRVNTSATNDQSTQGTSSTIVVDDGIPSVDQGEDVQVLPSTETCKQ